MLANRLFWPSLTLLAVVLTGYANADEATKLPPEQQAALDEVVKSVRKNDEAIKSFHVLEVMHVGASDSEADPKPVKGKGQGPFTNTFDPIPKEGVTLRYDIWIDGLNERSEEETTGDLFVWHDRTETIRWPDEKELRSSRSEKKAALKSKDPRHIAFLRDEGTLVNLLTGNSGELAGRNVEFKHQIQSVQRVDIDERELIIIEAKNPNGPVTTVVQCDAAYNYLPTRVYYRMDDGAIDSKTDIKYTQVAKDPQPVWFPKSAIQKFSFPHRITSPNAEDWSQTVTIEFKDLDMNAKVPKGIFLRSPRLPSNLNREG